MGEGKNYDEYFYDGYGINNLLMLVNLQYLLFSIKFVYDIDSLVQDCRNSIANAMELPQSCTKPSM